MGTSEADIAEEARALLDFVLQNSKGLRGVPKDTAESVLQCLMDENMSPSRLLTRAVNSSDPVKLFDFLYDAIEKEQPERRLQLLDAIVRLPDWVWVNGVLNHCSVAARYDRAEDFAHLLESHRTELLNEEVASRIMGDFSSDKYWLHRVRWFIVKGDFRRAWDELGKAERGFFIGGKEHMPRFGKYEPEYYCFAATHATIDIVGWELYEAMERENIFPTTPGIVSQLAWKFAKIKEYFRIQRNARRRKKVGSALP